MPEPQGLEFTDVTFDDYTRYYLYNPAAKMFFASGNEYNTRASVATFGYEVWFTSSVEEDAPAGSYQFNDNCAHPDRNLGDKDLFTDDGGSTWVDRASQGNYSWSVTKVGDYYRIQNVALIADIPSFDGKYFGWDGTDDNRLYMLTPEEGFVDWKFVTASSYEAFVGNTEAYEAYTVGVQKFNTAKELKKLLEDAEAIGANVAEQLAVYTNTSSTLEELKAAIEAVKVAIEERKKEIVDEQYEKATVENPVDVTDKFIVNPSFKGDNLSGWSGDAWGSYSPKENAEQYNKNYNTYQEITGLREGVYKFNVHAFYRAGNAQPAYDNYKAQNDLSRYAKVYADNGVQTLETPIASPFTAGLTAQGSTGTWSSATDAETGETFYIPNNMIAADEFFGNGYCNDNAVIINVTDGNLKVGAKKETTISGDWSIFDDFSLTYYGDGGDAYKLILNNVMNNLEDFSNLEDVYTYSYLDAYNAAVAATQSANTKEEILSAIEAIQNASADLKKNVELWKQLAELCEEAKAVAINTAYIEDPYRLDAGEWADFDYVDMLRARTATNEELEAECTKARDLIDACYLHPVDGAETDMTNLMKNPNFTDYGDGWTRVAASGGNVAPGGLSNNPCYEAWNNANFDIYQNVENAPMGVYRISVQGFYRYGRSAFQSFLNGDYYTTKETCPVFVYMNANQTPFTNVYGDPVQIYDAEFYSASNDATSETLPDGTTVYFPNGMQSASIAFSAGMYTQSAYGLVAHTGDVMRIGVKGSSNQLNDSWSIWDNFKIVYCGYRADVVQPVLEQAMIDAENSLNGAIGKDVVEKLQNALDAAREAIASGDGTKMFEALTNIFSVQEEVAASKAIFAELTAANEQLANAISNAVASADIINEANALNAAINDGIENHSYADADVPGLIEQIKVMINRLGIPRDMDLASDSNPIECSSIIINPAYVDGDDHGWTGGAAVNATVNDAEKFNTNYNYYQLLQGLPEGTYRVVVQGFYRAGTATNDYTSYIADPNADSNAFLYAAVGEDTVSVAMHRLASQALVMETLPDGWLYCDEASLLAVPNSMTTAGDAFNTPNDANEMLYSNNNVVVKVGAEGKLVIGLKKDVHIDTDWTIWANWQLFYYGKNSTLEPSGNALSIDALTAGNVTSIEVFTVNGTRVSGLQKGVNIVRETLSDGTIRVRKVSVK
ncbi:MAG: hypothetical protein J5529_05900 [Prevotella sp.]|nr:hypothetical protein [Prevotella sp.]